MSQLSKDEILNELKRLDFRNTDESPLEYAEQWTRAASSEIVNVKKHVKRCPLVIHSRHKAIQGELESIPGVVVGKRPFRKSSQFKGFEREVNDRPTPSYFGIDYGFSSHLSLSQFLDVLLGESATIDEQLDEIRRSTLDATTKSRLIDARLGQGKYRRQLIAMWCACAVTGCAHGSLLRASHIKSWKDSSNDERLDPHNGLLLAAGLDAAFDKGLISFKDDGEMVARSDLSPADAESVGIRSGMRLRKALSAQSRSYLAQHRHRHGFE